MLLKSIWPFICILYLQMELCASLNILGVFPMGGKSHYVVTGRLMKELAARGHQVDVINAFPQKQSIPNFRDIIVRDSKTDMIANSVTYNLTQKFSAISLKYLAKMAGTDTCMLLEHPVLQDILKHKKGAYDVIVVEMFVSHCFLAIGQHLGAPVIGVVVSKIHDWIVSNMASPLNPSYMSGVYSSYSQEMTFWERVRNTLITNYHTIQMDYYMDNQLEQVEKYFGRKLSSMKELFKDVSIILVNSHFSISDIRPFNPDIVEVGGLHVADDGQKLQPDLQEWLDESRHGCVLFTLGSMVKIESYPHEILRIFYEMFERIAPVRVIWKVVDPSMLPDGLPRNVRTLQWIPQVAVLKHKNLKLFITHGGLIGTQEAIAYKVPMIGLPIFADQHTNIQTYANKKIAIALSFRGLTADILTDAVKTVLYDPTYRKNIEKMSDLFMDRPMSAIDTAIYWIEYTARHPKVLNSPAMKLTWWQFYLIDVYGFIFACFLAASFIIMKTLKFFWKCTWPQKKRKDSMELKKNE